MTSLIAQSLDSCPYPLTVDGKKATAEFVQWVLLGMDRQEFHDQIISNLLTSPK